MTGLHILIGLCWVVTFIVYLCTKDIRSFLTLFGLFFLWVVVPRVSYDRPVGEQIITEYSPDYWYNVPYYKNGQGPSVIIYGSVGRSSADFNGLIQKMNAAGYMVLTPSFENRLDGENLRLQRYSEISLALFHEILPVETNYCIIAEGFGSDVVRELTIHDPNISGVILISPNGDSIMNYENTRGQNIKTLGGREEAFFYQANKAPKKWSLGQVRHGFSTISKIMKNSIRTEWPNNKLLPTLILHGEKNSLFSQQEIIESLSSQNIQMFDFVEIPSASRALLFEQHELIEQYVLDFLQQHCVA